MASTALALNPIGRILKGKIEVRRKRTALLPELLYTPRQIKIRVRTDTQTQRITP